MRILLTLAFVVSSALPGLAQDQSSPPLDGTSAPTVVPAATSDTAPEDTADVGTSTDPPVATSDPDAQPADVVPSNGAAEAATAESAAPPAPPESPGAKIFLQKCTGCHSIGGGPLLGPDLKPTFEWPRKDLENAIIRMEKSVGLMQPAEIGALTDLLLSENAAELLSAAQKQIHVATAALDPPSPELGRDLFHGQATFQNGGLSCAACHEAGGRGGNLAIELHTSFTRLGEMPLMSAMENPGFPIMRGVYTTHPVTKQEAVHVASYLQSLTDRPMQPNNPPLHMAGMGIAALAFGGIGFGYRKRLRGVRANLVRRTNGRTR